ncbi:MAG TPA: hypothetical protein VMV05_08320 [bacterium]|nr:hypothetical protein [bacterium]
METPPSGPEKQEIDPKMLEQQLEAFRRSQQAYLEKTFQWLIDFVASYFPGDQLAIRDLDLEVHIVQTIIEEGKMIGSLVYRFRKFMNKKEFFEEMSQDYREGLEIPEVLFVDTETSAFEPPKTLEGEGLFIEMPPDKLTGNIRGLRDEMKRRARLRQLRESV